MRAINKRLEGFGLGLEDIDAILVTHEHTDHIASIKRIYSKYETPVICNRDTARGICDYFLEKLPCHIFTTSEPFNFKDIEIFPYSIPHDALDPVGYILSYKNKKLGICTDTGHLSAPIIPYLTGVNYLYIESNHEPDLVRASARPALYKQRVLSRMGHLSNAECTEMITKLNHPGLRHIYLAHLSQDCNHPELAVQTIWDQLDQENSPFSVDIAKQNEASPFISFDLAENKGMKEKEVFLGA